MYVIQPGSGGGCVRDPDGDALFLVAAGPNTTYGGKVEITTHEGNPSTHYTPPSSFTGDDYFYFTVKDSRGASTRFTFRVTVG
jgi:hypothetical protein